MGKTLIDNLTSTQTGTSLKIDQQQNLKSLDYNNLYSPGIKPPFQNFYNNNYQINSTNPSSVSSSSTSSSSSLSSPNSYQYFNNNCQNYNQTQSLTYHSLNNHHHQQQQSHHGIKLEADTNIETKRKIEQVDSDSNFNDNLKLAKKFNSNFESQSGATILFDFYDCKSKIY
jgi:hypothetical protein